MQHVELCACSDVGSWFQLRGAQKFSTTPTFDHDQKIHPFHVNEAMDDIVKK